MTLARVPLVLIGCFASIAVVGCGDASSATDTASGSETTGGTSTTTGGSTSGPTSSSTGDITSDATSSTAAEPTTTGTTGTPTTSSTTDTSGGPVQCGNDIVEPGEECDDGNLVDGDGCESDCQVGELLCGNGVLDPGESCDDGNGDPDDGCGASCASECGFLCLEPGQLCVPGFHAVQCASPGGPFGQPSPIANTRQLATLSVDGSHIALSPETTLDGEPRHLDAMYTDPSNAVFGFAGDTEDIAAAGSSRSTPRPAS